jgi:hypothetical protein
VSFQKHLSSDRGSYSALCWYLPGSPAEAAQWVLLARLEYKPRQDLREHRELESHPTWQGGGSSQSGETT